MSQSLVAPFVSLEETDMLLETPAGQGTALRHGGRIVVRPIAPK